jgi:quercetin dioxygenase-like cupin family protein
VTRSWIDGWTPADPPRIGYVALGAGDGDWVQRGGTPVVARDLGLAAASDGRLGAAHISNTGSVDYALDWHCHDNDFHFVYVLAGSFVLELEDGRVETLRAGSAAALPALLRHKEYDFAPDLEAVMVTAPAVFDTIQGRDGDLPARTHALDPLRRAVVTHEAPEAYEVGAGPRTFFRYRDLGTRAVTEDRIHVHIVRATGAAEGTGWHYHTMSQWFMVLDGEASIAVEDRPVRKLERFDSMCLGSGPEMRHVVGPVSADYGVIELCVPAEYETIAVEAPSAILRA